MVTTTEHFERSKTKLNLHYEYKTNMDKRSLGRTHVRFVILLFLALKFKNHATTSIVI